MNPIVQKDHPALRAPTETVAAAEFGTLSLTKLVRRMSAALAACDDGVALAAPQIAANRRVFIVSRKIFAAEPPAADLVFINPVIKRRSRQSKLLEEGCLSVRWWYGKVKRAEKVTIEAQDESGRRFTRHASGLLAQIFQHEVDHLNGVLFIDKAEALEEILPPAPPAALPPFTFFGTDLFAVTVLDELKNAAWLPQAVVTTPDQPRGRHLILTPSPVKIWAEKNQIPSSSTLPPSPFSLFIVASYGQILSPEILALPQFGTLNIHPSLLPKYRGPSPLQTAILNGDQETGVSIMLVDEKMDHGPILGARRVELGAWSFLELRDKLAKMGAGLLIEIVPKHLAGEIKPVAQDHAQATYTKKFTKADAEIKLSDPAELNYRKILALNPNPGAWLMDDNNKQIKILSAHLEFQPPSSNRLVIARVIPAGKKEMSWESYVRGKR